MGISRVHLSRLVSKGKVPYKLDPAGRGRRIHIADAIPWRPKSAAKNGDEPVG